MSRATVTLIRFVAHRSRLANMLVVSLCKGIAYLIRIWLRPSQTEVDRESLRYNIIVHARDRKGRHSHTLEQWVDVLNRMNGKILILTGPGHPRADILQKLNATRLQVTTFSEFVHLWTKYPELHKVPMLFTNAAGWFTRQAVAVHQGRTVFIGHGESDKPYSSSAHNHLFSDILVAGQVARARVEQMKVRGRVSIIGRPQALPPRPTRIAERPLRLLYAPTHDSSIGQPGRGFCSVSSFLPTLLEVCKRRGMELVVKPHPLGSAVAHLDRWRKIANELDNVLLLPPEADVRSQFEKTDILICDVTSVATDFATSLRPIVWCNPTGLTETEFRRLVPSSCCAQVVSDPGTFRSEVFWHALEVSEERKRFIHEVVAASGGDALRRFALNLGLDVYGTCPDFVGE